MNHDIAIALAVLAAFGLVAAAWHESRTRNTNDPD